MRIVILGDLHFPYHNEKALTEVLYQVKHIKPTHVVQIGDLYDQYCFSRFTRKNLDLPEQELTEARDQGRALWRRLVQPGRKCVQLLGNHDIRLIKRVAEKLPEAQEIIKRSVMELYQFKGVKTIEDDRTISQIGNVAFHHGYLSRLGDHMRYLGKSVVVGHSHVGGVVFEQRDGRTLWELNAGYLADETAEPLRYRPTTTSKWTVGYGFIEYRGRQLSPIFVPV